MVLGVGKEQVAGDRRPNRMATKLAKMCAEERSIVNFDDKPCIYGQCV
jgi:hypothetical protein